MRRSLPLGAALAAFALPAAAAFVPAPVPQGAFTTYTPSLSCGSGTLTTATATAAYQVTGKRVDWQATVTVTTNGTCAANLYVGLPSGLPVSSSRVYAVAGREDAVSGKMLQGVFAASGTTAKILNYDNTYPGATGAVLYLSGSYETQ